MPLVKKLLLFGLFLGKSMQNLKLSMGDVRMTPLSL